MSKKLMSMVMAPAFAGATTAMACPGDKDGCKCGSKAQKVSDEAKSAPCAKSADAPCSKSAGAPCSKSAGTAKLVSTSHGDRVEAVMAKLPKLMYKVGDKEMCCSQAASKLAEDTGTKMMYLVGDKSFDNEGDAKVALTAALEEEIANLKSMQFAVGSDCVRCPITAKSMAKKAGSEVMYRVAGIDFDCKDKAEKALTLVADAADGVKMTYKVGDKSFCCDKMAGAAAKEAHKDMVFVVGEEETPCKTTAQLMLTQAKVHAIIAAAAAVLAS